MFEDMGSKIAQLRPDLDPLASLDPALLDTLTKNAYEMVSIIDTAGNILFSGGALESITGFTPEDRVGRSCMDFVHPEDAEFVYMRTRQFIDDPTLPDHSDSVAARLRHRDGSYRHVEITGTRLSQRGKPALVVVHTRDVTQETRAIERSAEAQLQVDMAVWGGDLMMWQHDQVTGAMVATGSGALERRGVDPCRGADSEQRWAEQIHPADRPRVLEHYARQSSGALPRLDIEYRARSNTGAWVWLQERAQIVARNPDGSARRVAGVCVCIDEKRQLQQELEEANERLRLAVETGGIGVWDWDVTNGLVRRSAQWYRLLGAAKPPEASWTETKTGARELSHPDDRALARAFVAPVLSGEQSEFQFETRRMHASGEWRWMRTRGSVVAREADGKPSRIVGTMQDVHASRCAEEALRASEARHRRAVSLQKGYVVDVSHGPDGAVQSYWVSEGFKDVFGCSVEEFHVLGGWDRFTHPEDYGTTLQQMNSLHPGSSVEVFGRIVRADGNVRRLRGVHQTTLDPVTGGWRTLSTISDVTELEPALHKDLRLQSDVIENVPACIVLLNRERQIRYATRGLFGVPAEQLRGLDILPLFRPEWHEQIGDAFTRSEREARNVEIEGVAAAAEATAGNRYRLHIAPTASRDRASYWCVVIRDISDTLRDQSLAFHALGQDQQRIGHDLREGVGQQLAGVAMLLQSLAAQLGRQAHPLATEAGQIAALINHSVDDVRALSRSLSPVGVAPTGLSVALDGLVERARSVGGLNVECTLDIEAGHTICPVDADHVFGIIDEAVTNAMRHAQARNLWIRLVASATRLELEISDDGRGLAATAISSGNVTQGLALMMHRARGMGATLSFGRREPQGTSIRCLRFSQG